MMKKLIQIFLMMTFLSHVLVSQQEMWITSEVKDDAGFFEQYKAFREYWTARGVQTDKLPKGKGYKAFERYAWFMMTRLNEKDKLNSEGLWRGWEEKQKNFASSDNRENTANWTVLGPQTSIPSNGGGAGRINCIAFNPTNTNIIWVGTPSGGLWKSTNGGTSWTTNTDKLPNSIGVSSIAIDPTNTNIMYIGTGDRDAGDTYATGVLKSTDGGNTWFSTGLSWTVNQGITVSKLIIHPTSASTLIAATSNGIYRTTDGGSSWTQVATGNYKDLEVHPANATIWYAAGYGGTVGVYKSTNSGVNWYKVTSGLPSSGVLRCELAVTPHSRGTVYALFAKNGTGTEDDYEFYGLYISNDSATTFSARYTGTKNLLGWTTTGNDNGGQGWYDLTLAVSPVNVNHVFVGGVNIWRSTDGGVNWTCVGVWDGTGSSYVHADHHALEFLPGSGTTLFSGNDGGLFKSTNTGTGWFDLSNGLGIHQYYRIGCSQTNANIIYGGAQDNGTDRYSSGTWTRVIGGDGMECIVDYTNANIAYGSLYYGNLYRTTTGGSFSDMTDPSDDGDWVTPYVMHPTTSTTLFYATSKVYRCTNASSTPTWTAISPNLVGLYYKLTALAVAPSNVNYIYTANKDSFFRTTNGGTNWQYMSGVPSRVKYIAVHPTNPSQVYVVIGGYTAGSKVYVSTNAGASWTNISGTLPNIPANCITLNPDYPDHIYVGTDLGVFFSENGGASWVAFDQGLPNVIVNELEIQRSAGKIRAATYGRGLWESPIVPIPQPKTITVTAPNGGENLTAGSSTNITWTSTGSITNVKIEYSLDGGTSWTTIVASTANDGSEAWTVPSSATTQGRIRVSDASNASINDISNANFTITVTGLTVTAPNGGENWTAGSSRNITWTTSGTISNVKIEYSTNSGTNWIVITSSVSNTGSYAWTVPNTPATTCRVRVSNAANAAVNDISDANFTISSAPTPVTILSEGFETNTVPGTYWLAADQNSNSGSDYWGDKSVSAGSRVRSGSWSAFCAKNGMTTAAYDNNMNAYMEYKNGVNISGYTNVQISFWIWFKTENSYDYCSFQYWNGSSWVEFTGGRFTGNGTGSGTWTQKIYSVPSAAGTTFKFRWIFYSDGSVTDEGVYIDDIVVSGTPSGVIRSMAKGDAELPVSFRLEQNHPNPFNPSTTIRFALPEASKVTLHIYNTNGQRVRTLVNQNLKAGYHEAIWDGRNDSGELVASGMYIYRLQAGSYVKSMKMMLMK